MSYKNLVAGNVHQVVWAVKLRGIQYVIALRIEAGTGQYFKTGLLAYEHTGGAGGNALINTANSPLKYNLVIEILP